MPALALEAGCRDIARQLVDFDHGDGIEVILGGGRAAENDQQKHRAEHQTRRVSHHVDVLSQSIPIMRKRIGPIPTPS